MGSDRARALAIPRARAQAVPLYLLVLAPVAVLLGTSSSWPLIPRDRALADAGLQALAAGLVATVILVTSADHARTRRTWHWAGLAALSWCGGQTWLTFELALTGTLVRPSPADGMFVLAAVCAVIAALSFPSLPQGPRGRWRLAIDGCVLAGSVAFLVLDRLDPLLPTNDPGLLALAYPLADCLVMTVLLIAGMRAPRCLLPSLGTAVLGLLVLSMTNLEVFRLALQGRPVLDSPVNAGFVVGLGLVGLGALLQTDPGRDDTRVTSSRVEQAQRLLPYVLLPVVAWNVVTSGEAPQRVPLLLLAGLSALLVLRQVLVVEENAALTADVVRRSRRYEALVRGASELVLVVKPDGMVAYASPSVGDALVDRDGADGPWSLVQVAWQQDRQGLVDALAEAGRHGVSSCRIRVEGQHRPLVLEARLTNRSDDPAVAGLVVNARDITDQAAAEASLADSERRYRRIVETATEGIWVSDADAITRFINARAAEMMGLPLEGLVGRPTLEILANVMTPEMLLGMHEKIEERRRGIAGSYDFTLVKPDGRTVHAHVTGNPMMDDEGRFEGVLTMITDITARVELENQLRHDARTDALTGLANRSLLSSRIATALQAADPRHPPAVIYCDLDGFKQINDAWGHDAGDELLRKVAQRLLAFASPYTMISRLGGDEFAILLDGPVEVDVETVARAVMASLRAPYSLSGREHHIDVSVGIAVASPGDDVGSVLRNADLAMYQAKNDGRGRYRLYESEMHAAASARLRLEQALRHALDRDELTLHYQPMVSLATGTCVGAEALTRWEHPDLGMIPPDQFIPIAESSDLILSIGHWVLEQALADAAAWRHPLSLSVNVAPQQLMDRRHVRELEAMLTGSAVTAERVILEVTERSLLAGEGPREALVALRATGAKLALDDFGTGYSSIAHLRDHPVDILKLDRSYVSDVAEDSPSRTLAMAIVNMSRQLGISCTAEGIETPEQAAVLRGAGCAHAQGYLYAAPMPHAELMAWMDARPAVRVPNPRPSDQDAVVNG
jgi:diguanylate cyclase (GGDEF)-like protein/PAS domain S-box-containing protein